MLKITTDSKTDVVTVEPEGSLQESDFEKLDAVVDKIIADKGSLPGLLIYTESFPGWDDFSAFLGHRRFWIDHHKKISKVAVVTNSPMGSIAESLTKLLKLVNAKHFKYSELQKGIDWITASN